MKLRIACGRPRRAVFFGAAGLAMAVLAAPASAQEPAQTVTLDEAVRLAIENSPDMAAAEGVIDDAAWGERTAWAEFLPNLSVSTGSSFRSGNQVDPTTGERRGATDNYSAGLSAGVPLFTGFRRGAQIDQARAETYSAEAGLVEQRFNVAMQAKTSFFDVLRNDELVQLAEARVGRAEEVLEAAQRRMDVGSATRSDVLQAQLELSQAKQALLQAEHEYRVAQLGLGRMVGVDGPIQAELTESLDPAPLPASDQELHQMVLASAPSVRSAEAALQANQAGVRNARSQYMPSLNLNGGYNWSTTEFTVNEWGRPSWNMGFNLSFPVFNRFSRERNMSQSRAQVTIAEIRLRDTQRMVRNELDRVLGALRLAEEQLALSEEALEVAQEDLRVQQERYRLGVSTILEQITSQINLAEAEQNVIAARYDYQIARAELEALAGRDL